jgi:hypothetical protein
VPVAPSVSILLPGRPFASNTISINRTNFIRMPVRITAEGVPAGMRVNTVPIEALPGAVEVVVEALNTVQAGTYTITIRGSASGQADQSTTFQVVVSAGAQ